MLSSILSFFSDRRERERDSESGSNTLFNCSLSFSTDTYKFVRSVSSKDGINTRVQRSFCIVIRSLKHFKILSRKRFEECSFKKKDKANDPKKPVESV